LEEAVGEVSRPESLVIEVETDHRLTGPEPLVARVVKARKRNDDNSTTPPKEHRMDVSKKEREDANRTGMVVRKKLLEIMDLQADIDALLRDKHPTPLGSAKWKNVRLETLQRMVAMIAIQFILYEPDSLVAGNDEFKVGAEKLLEAILAQLKAIGDKPTKG
jgi:hypothetical protein